MPFVPAGVVGTRQILRILTVGFCLVLLLLGVSTYVASREWQQIQADSAGLVADHLKTARLVDALEAEQRKMDRLLFALSRSRPAPAPAGADELTRDLAEAREAIQRTLALSPPAASRARWDEIVKVGRRFTDTASRVTTNGPGVSDRDLDALFADHESFVQLVGYLVKEDAERSVKIESAIEEQSRTLGGEAALFLGLLFVLALLCAVLTVVSTLGAIRQMERQSEELQRVSWQMLQGQEHAARRFSHELHDELGQSLAGLRAMLSGGAAAGLEERRAECLRLVDEAISNVRELSQLLRPVILDDFGLASALAWLSERFEQRTGIAVDCASSVQGRLTDETETQLFRITQEALTNVARHSGAKRVRIRLREHAGTVFLTVEDDGRGLAKAKEGAGAAAASIGLVGMRARARQAAGDLTIDQGPMGGVRVEASVPAAGPPDTKNAEHQEDPYFVG